MICLQKKNGLNACLFIESNSFTANITHKLFVHVHLHMIAQIPHNQTTFRTGIRAGIDFFPNIYVMMFLAKMPLQVALSMKMFLIIVTGEIESAVFFLRPIVEFVVFIAHVSLQTLFRCRHIVAVVTKKMLLLVTFNFEIMLFHMEFIGYIADNFVVARRTRIHEKVQTNVTHQIGSIFVRFFVTYGACEFFAIRRLGFDDIGLGFNRFCFDFNVFGFRFKRTGFHFAICLARRIVRELNVIG